MTADSVFPDEPWEVIAQGEANEYFIQIRSNGNWVIGFLLNGEMLVPQQLVIAKVIASAPAALRALALHKVYQKLPSDRGGHGGPKGMAWAAFIEARDAALEQADWA